LLLKLALAFGKTGLFTFGSGYAMLAQMEKELVEIHGWLTSEQFADVVAISEVTPGPITVNMATFVGYRIAGYWGSLAATLGLVAGPIAAILIVARFYPVFRHNPYVDAAFKGLRPVVVALILVAVLKLAKSSIFDVKSVALFAVALVSLYLAKVSPLYVALAGIVLGMILYV
jgi:chromate transporter